MPSPLKRSSVVRLLASLRSSRAGAQPSSFPVRTGFPTSLADIVVRNHGRLRKPRKPRRPAAAAATARSPCPVVAVEEISLTQPPPPTLPLSPVAVDAPQVFRLRPELLAVGGAVALALLAVWGEGTVAAFTVAALSLLWIESASRRPRPAETMTPLDSRASPILEAGEAPRSSSSDSDRESEASTPRAAERRELAAAGGGDGPATPTRKGRISLRRLISRKLQRRPRSRDSSSLSLDGDAENPEAVGGDAGPVPVLKTQSSVSASESSIEWSSSSSAAAEAVAVVVDRRGPGAKFPLSAFVPVILAGLAAGKLPATALAVLCVAFSGAVRRLS